MDNVLNLLKCRPCTACEKYIDGGCTVWECPFDGAVVHEKENEGHYQYAIFDEDGNKKSINTLSLRRAVETKEVLETFTCNEGKKLIVKKRLVMAWENVEDGEDGL